MSFDPRAPFARRAENLPHLGIGISTEFQAQAAGGLDPLELRRLHPGLVEFLEVGCDLERGLDQDTRDWVASEGATTYHFLDVNLEEHEDLDERWVEETLALAQETRAAWLCGDAGLWHAGPRDRGHGTLQPPILEPDVAEAMGRNVRHLREASGLEVLPENPPGQAYVGRMPLLEFFASVCESADSGMLLDVAHLAIHQQVMGEQALYGLEAFPMERVVEIHVAGGQPFDYEGRTFIDDNHGSEVSACTWEIFEHVLPRAKNLRAVIFECERNSIPEVLPTFERIRADWRRLGNLA